jgi:hypothetical protein
LQRAEQEAALRQLLTINSLQFAKASRLVDSQQFGAQIEPADADPQALQAG